MSNKTNPLCNKIVQYCCCNQDMFNNITKNNSSKVILVLWHKCNWYVLQKIYIKVIARHLSMIVCVNN